MLNFLAQIPLNAERLSQSASPGLFEMVFTNSIVVAAIVAVIVLVFARRATAKMELVPNKGSQNLFEAIIEALYDMLEGIVGAHMAPKAFPLLATLFLFILASNWFGLIPGVGTIGFGHGRGPLLSLQELDAPLLRPANADLNLTLGMALVFTFYWVIWSFQELGVGGFFYHLFGPKGQVGGILKYPLILIFLFVGVIEVISIAFRPVSLSLRLFGNIYAGENLMHTMSDLGETMGMPAVISGIMKVIRADSLLLPRIVGRRRPGPGVHAVVRRVPQTDHLARREPRRRPRGCRPRARGPRRRARQRPRARRRRDPLTDPFSCQDHPKRVDGGTKQNTNPQQDKLPYDARHSPSPAGPGSRRGP